LNIGSQKSESQNNPIVKLYKGKLDVVSKANERDREKKERKRGKKGTAVDRYIYTI